MFFHKYASPKVFYGFSGKLIPWFAAATSILLGVGLYQGLFVAPPDYQQGESVRIMFSTAARAAPEWTIPGIP